MTISSDLSLSRHADNVTKKANSTMGFLKRNIECAPQAAKMLDHPITVVLNVFGHWKATGLKVSKFMSIQNQEEHIGHVKQLKSDICQDRKLLSQA